ncbi:MAG TPA: hypothetical protein V6C76_01040 [Drouetiella sp.]
MQENKGSVWVARVVKLMIFFAILGMIAMGIGGYMMQNTFNSILKDVNPPAENPPLQPGAPTTQK